MVVDLDRWKELKEKEKMVKKASEAIRVQEKHLPKVVARFKKELDEMRNEIDKLKS